jgi:hypothetical protein
METRIMEMYEDEDYFTLRIDRDGLEVVILSVPWHFAIDELIGVIKRGMRQAKLREEPYLAVIQYSFIVPRPFGKGFEEPDVVNLLAQMDKLVPLTKLRQEGIEYRIALVADASDWNSSTRLGALFNIGKIMLEAHLYRKSVESHPMSTDPWILHAPNVEKAMELCREDVSNSISSGHSVDIDAAKQGSPKINITVTHGNVNIGGDVVGRDKTTNE